ncbi:hypothetical protein GYMLUDRAFT_64964 [Collybiopsis luxurians FD-317 M1]|uniref:Uncharacterized protein n=1 Tax=Collybiopsis luxurians FD-317 M1 TaxID=944289 RepID=A0A0D0C0Q2_9AGAR|nr:hypothetical protein GYMLUDRAFT_64964 [Collybiopsis luxurians FD-317 M1]
MACTHKKAKHLKQSVTISGLGKLVRHIGEIESFEIKESEGRRMLKIGNHVFTPKWEAPTMEWFTPLCEVDPDGTIESMNMEHSLFMHRAENMVDFGEERSKGEGEKRYDSVSYNIVNDRAMQDVHNEPSEDTHRGHCRCGILNGGYTYKARNENIAHAQSYYTVGWNTHTGSVQVQLKKRSAFDDEVERDMEEARKKLKGLAVNEKVKMVEG